MTVLTGSMSPRINPGDMIIDKTVKTENIKVGDVITYRVNSEMLITHRVIEVVNKEGKPEFKTKGDANNVDDNNLVTEEQLVGRYSFRIPYAGYVSNFARSIWICASNTSTNTITNLQSASSLNFLTEIPGSSE